MDATVDPSTGLEAAAVSGGTALYFQLNDSGTTSSPSSTNLPPRRLQRRFDESQKLNNPSAQEIQAKHKQADLRRQKYHDSLASKAQLLSSKLLSESTSTELLPSQHTDRGYNAKANATEKNRSRSKSTTIALTKAYKNLNINSKSIMSMPFEQLANQLESPTTIQTVKALLKNLESYNPSTLQNINHLLEQVAAPSQTVNTPKITRPKLQRYPTRVVLCAYMILGQADLVTSGNNECKIALIESTRIFVREFESLTQLVLSQTSASFESQLKVFDESWCSYLHNFLCWKVKDATSLKEDLVKAASLFELSTMHTTLIESDNNNPEPALQATETRYSSAEATSTITFNL
jgi:hypothetical protein